MNNIRFTPARMYSVFGLTLFAFALQNTALQAAAIVPTSSCTINGTAAPCSNFYGWASRGLPVLAQSRTGVRSDIWHIA